MLENMTEQNGGGKKRKIVLIAVLVSCLAILAVGTSAYFTAEETAFNVITTGTLSMQLVEETSNGEPWPEEGVSGVMPGEEVDKVAYVVNDGNVDFYVRVSLRKTFTLKNAEVEPDLSLIRMDIDTENWTEKDGYYYYNKALKPGEATEPLFTSVTMDAAMGNDYMDAKLEIEVAAQAVQSRNNSDSALTATGWTAE